MQNDDDRQSSANIPGGSPAEPAPVASPDAAVSPPSPPARPSNWSGKTIFWLGLGSIVLAFFAAIGSGWGLWNYQFGFQLLKIAFGIAVLAVAGGLFLGWWARRKSRVAARPLRWTGMVLGGAIWLLLGGIVVMVWRSGWFN